MHETRPIRLPAPRALRYSHRMMTSLASFSLLALLLQDATSPTDLTAPTAATAPADDTAAIERALQQDAQSAARDEAQSDAETQPRRGPLAGIPGANPDISAILDVAAAYFSDDEPLQAGAHDPQENGFTLQQLELAIGHNVDPYFRFDGYIVFSPTEIDLEEAYGTTLALPYNLQARFGKFLTRFGRLNSTHPHAWAFVDQPIILSKFFGGEANRGVGAELSYLTPLPWYVELIGSTTDPRGEETNRSFLGANERGLEKFSDFQYTLALKQFFPLSDDWSFNWGLSGAAGPNNTDLGNRTGIAGTDVYVKWRPVSQNDDVRFVALQAEYMARNREVPGDLLTDHGGYAYLLWHFAHRWDVGVRGERVSGVLLDPLDPAWVSKRTRYAVETTFFPTEFSRLRLQIQHDDPRLGFREAYVGGFLAVEIAVGAHAAHKY